MPGTAAGLRRPRGECHGRREDSRRDQRGSKEARRSVRDHLEIPGRDFGPPSLINVGTGRKIPAKTRVWGLEREVFCSDAEFLASDTSGSDGAAAPQSFLPEDVEISVVASAPAFVLSIR
jgi:hypothetical protein